MPFEQPGPNAERVCQRTGRVQAPGAVYRQACLPGRRGYFTRDVLRPKHGKIHQHLPRQTASSSSASRARKSCRRGGESHQAKKAARRSRSALCFTPAVVHVVVVRLVSQARDSRRPGPPQAQPCPRHRSDASKSKMQHWPVAINLVEFRKIYGQVAWVCFVFSLTSTNTTEKCLEIFGTLAELRPWKIKG